MMRPKLGKNERGDTIIEVMIVLAVLGLSVSLAYQTASKSLLATRGAQESSEAVSFLQSQIEAVRYMAPNVDPHDATTNVLPSSPTATFCIDTTVNKVVTPDCTLGGRYKITVTYGANQPNTFEAVAKWDDVSGHGTDSATISYRYYP